MNDNISTTTLLNNLADSISLKTGIDTEAATKVVHWLVAEGVLDMPVVAEQEA